MYNLCRSVLHLTRQGRIGTSFSSIKVYGYRTVFRNAFTKRNHTTKRLFSTKKSPDGKPRKDDFVLIYKNSKLLYLKWIPLMYKVGYFISAGIVIYNIWKCRNQTIQISSENTLFQQSCMLLVGAFSLCLVFVLNHRTLQAIYKQRNSQLYVALRQHWYLWSKEIPFTKADITVLSQVDLLINKRKFYFFKADFIRPHYYNELFGFDEYEDYLNDLNKKSDHESEINDVMRKRAKKGRKKY